MSERLPLLTNTYAILLNGPSYSGKDTGADALMAHIQPRKYLYAGELLDQYAHFDRFSMPLKRSVCAWLNVRCDEKGWSTLEATKDEIIPALGVSYRQAQIELSELHMKRYGQDVFGRLIVERMAATIGDIGGYYGKSARHYFVIPDSGFPVEALPVVQSLPPDHVLVVRVQRDGRDFTNDSRSYIEVAGATHVDITNNGEQQDYEKHVVDIVKKWMK